jgi:ABC-type Co2+ transport system permease subunit
VTQLVIATVLCAVYLLLQMQASPFEDLGGTCLGLDVLLMGCVCGR